MDNASAYGAEDCGFKSHRGCYFLLLDYNHKLRLIVIINYKWSTSLAEEAQKILTDLSQRSKTGKLRILTTCRFYPSKVRNIIEDIIKKNCDGKEYD